MRVAITGATGNVGTSVRRRFETDPAIDEIVGIARRLPDHQAGPTRWLQADVANDDLAPSFEDADAVVHLAWQFHPARHPNQTWASNAVGTARVLDAVARTNVRTLLYASSLGAYSPAPGRRVDETWPTHSLSTAAYGREKAYAERLLDAFEAQHPEVRVVRMRPTLMFQRSSASEQRRIFAGPLVPPWFAQSGRLPRLPFPAGLRFQALHTDDAADAFSRALHADVRGPFNLAAEPVIDGATVAELLDTRLVVVPDAVALRVLELAWGLHLVPGPPAMLDLILHLPLLDCSRARRELGWSPTRTSIDAMREMLHGFETGAGGTTPPLVPDSVGERLHEVATLAGERE